MPIDLLLRLLVGCNVAEISQPLQRLQSIVQAEQALSELLLPHGHRAHVRIVLALSAACRFVDERRSEGQ